MAWDLWRNLFEAGWKFWRGTLFALFISGATAPLLWQCDIGAALPDVIRIGVVYDQAWSSEEAKLLSQALDRANINASDTGDDLPQHGESGSSGSEREAKGPTPEPGSRETRYRGHLPIFKERVVVEEAMETT
ncbi:uncharacterized protein LOC119462343 [Dermacentor silvarum]|uniref:uncharacterized protein LOC119462343 n=1 Tax=Dermacentor silvarum TaxID=543639 RepID=UPI00189821CD|nr:uncharacterized protein LOC119462343 [Dermacentor silvarum]